MATHDHKDGPSTLFLIATGAGKPVWACSAPHERPPTSNAVAAAAGLFHTLAALHRRDSQNTHHHHSTNASGDVSSDTDVGLDDDELREMASEDGSVRVRFRSLKRALHFVAVVHAVDGRSRDTSTNMPPALPNRVLDRILQLLHLQTVFVLTQRQVLRILHQNPGFDVASLLGGTEQHFNRIVYLAYGAVIHTPPSLPPSTLPTSDIDRCAALPLIMGAAQTVRLPRRLRDAITAVLSCYDLKPNPTNGDPNNSTQNTICGPTLSHDELKHEQSLLYTILASTDGRLASVYNGSGILAAGRCSAPSQDIDRSNSKNRSRDSSPNRFLNPRYAEQFIPQRHAEEAADYSEFVAEKLTSCSDPLYSQDLHLLLNMILADKPEMTTASSDNGTVLGEMLQSPTEAGIYGAGVKHFQQHWIPCCLPNLGSDGFVYVHYSYLQLFNDSSPEDDANISDDTESLPSTSDDEDGIVELTRASRNQKKSSKAPRKRSKRYPKLCLIQVSRSKDAFYYLSRRLEHIVAKLNVMEKHGVLRDLRLSLTETGFYTPLKEVASSGMIPGVRHFAFFRNPEHVLGCPCIPSHFSSIETAAHTNYMADITAAIIAARYKSQQRRNVSSSKTNEHKILSAANQWVRSRYKSLRKKRTAISSSSSKKIARYGILAIELILDPRHKMYNQMVCRCPCAACRHKWPAASDISAAASASRCAAKGYSIHQATSLPFMDLTTQQNFDLYISKPGKPSLAAKMIAELKQLIPQSTGKSKDKTQHIFYVDDTSDVLSTEGFADEISVESHLLEEALLKQLFKHRAHAEVVNDKDSNVFSFPEHNSELNGFLNGFSLNKTINGLTTAAISPYTTSTATCSHGETISQARLRDNQDLLSLAIELDLSTSIEDKINNTTAMSALYSSPILAPYLNVLRKIPKHSRDDIDALMTATNTHGNLSDVDGVSLLLPTVFDSSKTALDAQFFESLDFGLEVSRSITAATSIAVATRRLTSPLYRWNTIQDENGSYNLMQDQFSIDSRQERCKDVMLEIASDETNEDESYGIGSRRVNSKVSGANTFASIYLPVDLNKGPIDVATSVMDRSNRVSHEGRQLHKQQQNSNCVPNDHQRVHSKHGTSSELLKAHTHVIVYLLRWFLAGYGHLRPTVHNYESVHYRGNDGQSFKNSTPSRRNSMSKVVQRDQDFNEPFVLLPPAPPVLCPCCKVTRECVISDTIRPRGRTPKVDSVVGSEEKISDDGFNSESDEEYDEEKPNRNVRYRNGFRLEMYVKALELAEKVPMGALAVKSKTGTTFYNSRRSSDKYGNTNLSFNVSTDGGYANQQNDTLSYSTGATSKVLPQHDNRQALTGIASDIPSIVGSSSSLWDKSLSDLGRNSTAEAQGKNGFAKDSSFDSEFVAGKSMGIHQLHVESKSESISGIIGSGSEKSLLSISEDHKDFVGRDSEGNGKFETLKAGSSIDTNLFVSGSGQQQQFAVGSLDMWKNSSSVSNFLPPRPSTGGMEMSDYERGVVNTRGSNQNMIDFSKMESVQEDVDDLGTNLDGNTNNLDQEQHQPPFSPRRLSKTSVTESRHSTVDTDVRDEYQRRKVTNITNRSIKPIVPSCCSVDNDNLSRSNQIKHDQYRLRFEQSAASFPSTVAIDLVLDTINDVGIKDTKNSGSGSPIVSIGSPATRRSVSSSKTTNINEVYGLKENHTVVARYTAPVPVELNNNGQHAKKNNLRRGSITVHPTAALIDAQFNENQLDEPHKIRNGGQDSFLEIGGGNESGLSSMSNKLSKSLSRPSNLGLFSGSGQQSTSVPDGIGAVGVLTEGHLIDDSSRNAFMGDITDSNGGRGSIGGVGFSSSLTTPNTVGGTNNNGIGNVTFGHDISNSTLESGPTPISAHATRVMEGGELDVGVEPSVVLSSKSETVVVVRNAVGTLIVGLAPRVTLEHARSTCVHLLNWVQRNEADLFVL